MRVNDFFEALIGKKSESESIFTPLIGEWEIASDTFHWENRTSLDGGKTWMINGEVQAKRKS